MAKLSKKSTKGVNRRGFLGAAAGAAAGAATVAVTVPGSEAQSGATTQVREIGAAPPPTAAQIQRDAGDARPPSTVRAATAPGSDLQVQVLRDLGIEYVASNPGSSFEGLQESLINYGNPPNKMPEFITALHEMSAVDMAHGYAKTEGKPMVALLHGTIGIQNGSMAIYQAFHDQTPVLLIAGRDEGFIAGHTADDMAGMVRSYTKWDAQPTTMEGSLRALQDAYNIAMTPPCAPTLVVVDMEFQKAEVPGMTAPPPPPLRVTGIDRDQAREIARGLVSARNPRIAVGRLRTPEGVASAVELAELVGASTSTNATAGPMSFPQRHPLCGPGADTSYDFTLGLEAAGAQASVQGPSVRTLGDRDVMSIGFGNMREDGGGGRGGGAPAPGANDITADAESSLGSILEEARRMLTGDNRQTIEQRSAQHRTANQRAYLQALREAVNSKKVGWDSSPISTARLYAELWPLIMNENWCLASPTNFSGGHHRQLWEHNKPYSFLGSQGAGGMGYGLGASIGAGLAAKDRDRIVINIQCDGDCNYSPGALWTAAHHRLPVLTIMHNNRAWHQETMFVEYVCGVRGRGTDRGHIGTTLRDPNIDYAKMAEAYGMAGEGPIEDPTRLAAAYKRGVAMVKSGYPYMIDVVTQPR